MLKIILTAVLSLSLINASAFAQIPESLERSRTAVLITDPQNEFLHPKGKLYPLVKDNLKQLNTIEHIDQLMNTATRKGYTLAVDPLVYNALDGEWINAGALQRQLLDMQALHRDNARDGKSFENSGADFYAPYKRYIYNGKTIVVAAHKMYGPESNDLIYQLRSRGIDTVILGGLVANLCVDSHMRALMENGFKVYVVKDAVAAPGQEAYQAALVNYGMIANGVLTTEQALDLMQ